MQNSGFQGSARLKIACALAAVSLVSVGSSAQQPVALTTADYARAESRLAAKTAPLIDHAVERVTWLKNDSAPTGGDRFWYKDTANGSTTFMLIDAVRATKVPAFDQAKMAAALNAAGIRNAAAASLPITDLEFADANATLIVTVRGERYRCALPAYTCAKQQLPPAHQQTKTNGQPEGGVSATAVGGNAGMSTNPVAAAPLASGPR